MSDEVRWSATARTRPFFVILSLSVPLLITARQHVHIGSVVICRSATASSIPPPAGTASASSAGATEAAKGPETAPTAPANTTKPAPPIMSGLLPGREELLDHVRKFL